jgi:hypothetical protein
VKDNHLLHGTLKCNIVHRINTYNTNLIIILYHTVLPRNLSDDEASTHNRWNQTKPYNLVPWLNLYDMDVYSNYQFLSGILTKGKELKIDVQWRNNLI